MSISEVEKKLVELGEKIREELRTRLEELIETEDKPLDELGHDELIPLIIAAYDDAEMLFEIAQAIGMSKVLSDDEKEHLYRLIDNPP